MSPRGNGAVPSTPGVSREELERLHQAHSHKLLDLEAEHEKSVNTLNVELDSARNKIDELEGAVARKAMEVQFLEQEQDDHTDEIKRYVPHPFWSLAAILLAIALIRISYN
jgi:hypothetical protein